MCNKTFEIYPEIKSEKVYFNNRFGIKIAGDLYLPVDYENQKKRPSQFPVPLAA